MEFDRPITESVCTPEDIGRYLDGELSADRELHLEMHISACSECRDELNLQKSFVRALDDNFDLGAVPELPDNFARRISVAAVSDIGGIRSSRERWTAIGICVLLTAFAIVALGGAATQPLNAASVVADKSFAIMTAVGSFFYNVAVSVVVLIRPISGALNLTVSTFAILGLLAFAGFLFGRRQKSSN